MQSRHSSALLELAPGYGRTRLAVLAIGLVSMISLLAAPARADYNYAVYSGNWTVLPDFDALTPIATGTTPTIGLSVTGLTEHFGLVFTGTLTVQVAGTYTFSTTTDDGSDLRIDSTTVVNNDGQHGATTVTGAIALTAGTHSLRIRYFEWEYEESLSVAYAPPGGALRPLPANGILDQPFPLVRYDFNETGNTPGSSGSERRPLETRNDAGTNVELHTAGGNGVSGLSGDRAFDGSGASDHGSVASAATNGFRADQSDYAPLDGLAQFTISGWFRTETTATLAGKTPRLVINHDGESGANGDGFNLQFFSDFDGDLKLEIDDTTGGGVNSTGTAYAAKQKWVFFAVSYDGNTTTNNVKFYRGFRNDTEAGGGAGSADVVLVTTASLDRGPVDAESVGLVVGNRAGGDRPFDGLLDEIRIDAGLMDAATLEPVREAAVAGPPPEGLVHVDTATISNSVQDQNAVTVTVEELSGVTYDADQDVFWAISDGGGRLLKIDADFDCDGNFTSATAVSAVTLVDNRDFEGVAHSGPGTNRAFICDEGSESLDEYSLVNGTFIQSVTIPAIYDNARSNRSFEFVTRSPNGSSMIVGPEQALTVDGPEGNSSSVPTISRWQRYNGALTQLGQVAYQVEPVHDDPVQETGSGLGDLSYMPDGSLLAVERSEGANEFLVRIFEVNLAGATDVSQGSLAAGLIGQTYTPAAKRLLLSDDDLGKLEGLAAKTVECGVQDKQVLLGVTDDAGPNVIHSFLRVLPLPEPGAVWQLVAGTLGLLVLRRGSRRR
jgi:hypothetical protein